MTHPLRRSDLATLAQTLNQLRTRSVDVVAPARSLSARGGALVVTDVEPLVTEDGVTMVDGLYRPTDVAMEGIAAKLEIPTAYLRRTRDVEAAILAGTHPGADTLFDVNVNTWLRRQPTDRRFLVRLLISDDGPGSDGVDGVVRALLSDSYRCIDHFDTLLACLQGLRSAGITSPTIDADLTDRRMVVRVTCPEIGVHGRSLIKNYRSPYRRNADGTPMTGEQLPMVWAGFVLTNSETGGGACTITPRAEFEVCRNGMTIKADQMREIHLGGKLPDAGVIRWSDETIRRSLDLVTAQTTDAVRAFLSTEYWDNVVRGKEREARVEVTDPPVTLAAVSKRFGYSAEVANDILSAFIDGGQRTAGGVMQAVTAVAHSIEDAEMALTLEMTAVEALEYAAVLSRRP